MRWYSGVDWSEWAVGVELDWGNLFGVYLGPLFAHGAQELGPGECGVRRWAVHKLLLSVGRYNVSGALLPLRWVFGLSFDLEGKLPGVRISVGPLCVSIYALTYDGIMDALGYGEKF